MGNHARCVLAVVLGMGLGLAACGGKEAKPDLAALEQGFQSDLATVKAIPCERPVLRGTAHSGSGTDGLRALLEPTDADLKACVVRRAAVAGIGRTGRTCDDIQRSAYCLAEPPTAAMVEALGSCGPALASAIERVAMSTGACSLRGAEGQQALADGNLSFLHLGMLVPVHAHAVAAGGQPADAIRLLLDATLVSLDQARGFATLVDMGIAIASTRSNVRMIAAIARDPALTADELDALGAELDRLIDAVPWFHDLLLGDQLTVVMRGARAYLRDEAQDPDFAVNSRAEATQLWRTTQALRAQTRVACPPATAALACASRLQAAGNVATPEDIDDVTLGVGAPMYADYARKLALTIAQLYALRLELALGAHARRTKTCPTAADVTPARLEARRLGAPLTLVAGADGELRIESVGALGSRSREEPYTLTRVGCKDGAMIAPATEP